MTRTFDGPVGLGAVLSDEEPRGEEEAASDDADEAAHVERILEADEVGGDLARHLRDVVPLDGVRHLRPIRRQRSVAAQPPTQPRSRGFVKSAEVIHENGLVSDRAATRVDVKQVDARHWAMMASGSDEILTTPMR